MLQKCGTEFEIVSLGWTPVGNCVTLRNAANQQTGFFIKTIIIFLNCSFLTEDGKNIKSVRGPLHRPTETPHVIKKTTFIVTMSL